MSTRLANQLIFKIKVNCSPEIDKAYEIDLLQDVLVDILQPLAQRIHQDQWLLFAYKAAAIAQKRILSCRMHQATRRILGLILKFEVQKKEKRTYFECDLIPEEMLSADADQAWPLWMRALLYLLVLSDRLWTYLWLQAARDKTPGYLGRLANILGIPQSSLSGQKKFLQEVQDELWLAYEMLAEPSHPGGDAILAFLNELNQAGLPAAKVSTDCGTQGATAAKILTALVKKKSEPSSLAYPQLSEALQQVLTRLGNQPREKIKAVLQGIASGNASLSDPLQPLINRLNLIQLAVQDLCQETVAPGAGLAGSNPGGGLPALSAVLNGLPARPTTQKPVDQVLLGIGQVTPVPNITPVPTETNLEQQWLTEAEKPPWPAEWTSKPRIALYWLLRGQCPPGSSLWAVLYGILRERAHLPQPPDLFPNARNGFIAWLPIPMFLYRRDLEEAKEVLEGWLALIPATTPAFAFLEIPQGLRDKPALVTNARNMVDNWLRNPGFIPSGLFSVSRSIRSTIVAALFIVFLERLIEAMKLVFKAARGYPRQPPAAESFLEFVLGKDFGNPRTYPTVDTVIERLSN